MLAEYQNKNDGEYQVLRSGKFVSHNSEENYKLAPKVNGMLVKTLNMKEVGKKDFDYGRGEILEQAVKWFQDHFVVDLQTTQTLFEKENRKNKWSRFYTDKTTDIQIRNLSRTLKKIVSIDHLINLVIYAYLEQVEEINLFNLLKEGETTE